MKRDDHRTIQVLFFSVLAAMLLILPACGGGGGGGSSGGDGIIKIGWDPNTESDLAGYRVYYGRSNDGGFTDMVDAGMAGREGSLVVYTIRNLVKGERYCIALTAYNTSNYESMLSNGWEGDADAVCGNAR